MMGMLSHGRIYCAGRAVTRWADDRPILRHSRDADVQERAHAQSKEQGEDLCQGIQLGHKTASSVATMWATSSLLRPAWKGRAKLSAQYR